MSQLGSPLLPLINLKRIAVFGAGTLVQTLLRNLAAGRLGGNIYYLGPEPLAIDGVICLDSLARLPGRFGVAAVDGDAVDLLDVLEQCASKGIELVLLYASELGAALLPAVRAKAAGLGIRLFGPRAFGCMLPHAGINLSHFSQMVPAGNLALVSQSTSVCANILDWNHSHEFAFSAVFGCGQSSDIELPEILDYLANDLKTDSILLYLEGLHDARRFLSAVRAAAAVKPVIAVKAGQHALSIGLAGAHIGVQAGCDDVFDAALRRAGVLRVRTIGEMFSAARALVAPRRPTGNRLGVVTNGGAPAIMALDLAAELGIVAADLSSTTRQTLQALPVAPWSQGNPIDVGFNASPQSWLAAIAACAKDPAVDGVLALLTPNVGVEPLVYAQAVIDGMQDCAKPILACVLGEARSQPARTLFARSRYPTFRTPENAVVAFAQMANWVRNQDLLLETPAALSSYTEPNADQAKAIIEAASGAAVGNLSLAQAKAVLAAFHIPVSTSESARAPNEALGGSPVRHLCISIRRDVIFGPVIALTQAGLAAEIYQARSIALPPLNPHLVADMLNVAHVARLLGPLQQKPAVAQEPVRDILLRVSEMASELPGLLSLDLILEVDENQAVAVDAGMTVQSPKADAGRYSHMAICPYPSQWVTGCQLKNGSACTLRPIRPDDAVLLQDFVRSLGAQSRYFRFFGSLNELSQRSLARFTQLDYGRELTLIALAADQDSPRLLGEANYACLPGGKICEFAVVIADDMAGLGLGSRLMRGLMHAARVQGVSVMRGQVLADNAPMLALMEALDFFVNLTDDENIVEVSRQLQ